MFSITPQMEQLDLQETIQHINDLPRQAPEKLLDLLAQHIDLPTLIPTAFYHKYNGSDTNDRVYSLECLLSILLFMQFSKMATAASMLVLLSFAPKVREFCRVPEGRIPDESVFARQNKKT